MTNPSRPTPLYKEALEVARVAYIAEQRRQSDPSAVVRATVAAYLRAHRAADIKRTDSRVSPVTRKLAALAIGRFVILDAMPTQAVRGRYDMARKLMGVPNATFTAELLPDGRVRVFRLLNGACAHRRDPSKNKKAVELASLKPGESLLSKHINTTRSKGQPGSNTKVAARKLLGNGRADWSFRMTNKGVRVTRLPDRKDPADD